MLYAFLLTVIFSVLLVIILFFFSVWLEVFYIYNRIRDPSFISHYSDFVKFVEAFIYYLECVHTELNKYKSDYFVCIILYRVFYRFMLSHSMISFLSKMHYKFLAFLRSHYIYVYNFLSSYVPDFRDDRIVVLYYSFSFYFFLFYSFFFITTAYDLYSFPSPTSNHIYSMVQNFSFGWHYFIDIELSSNLFGMNILFFIFTVIFFLFIKKRKKKS